MKTALYTKIILADDLADKSLSEAAVIKRAAAAGYALTQFSGWNNDDLGRSYAPGPRRVQADKNFAVLREIEVLFPDGCGYSDIQIAQTAAEPKPMPADDDADFQVSATF